MTITSGQQQVAGQGAPRARLVRGRWWIVAKAVALVVGAALLALLVAGVVPSAASGPAFSQRVNFGFALSAVALVVLVVAAVRVARAGWTSASGWVHGPVSTREQRARALAAVRGNQAVPEPELPLTVAVAKAADRAGRGALAWVAIALVLAGVGLGMATWWSAPMMVTSAAMLVLSGITARDALQARHWLGTHHRQSIGA